ncbi:MAG: hypothetical protein JXR56_03805 [Candidatus Cloacimonetes bacterium]|nr:hypothetical protein [Candidatus Cloacimonadota bacterium]
MKNNDWINEVTKKVVSEQKYRDGIPQLVVGTYLVLVMLMMLLSGNSAITVVFVPLIPILIETLRKSLTYPRVGYAKIKENKEIGKRMQWILVIMVFGFGILFFAHKSHVIDFRSLPSMYLGISILIAFTVLILFIFMFIRKPTSLALWYAFALLALASIIFIFKLTKHSAYYLVMCFGFVSTVIGAINLAMFIKKYPLLDNND